MAACGTAQSVEGFFPPPGSPGPAALAQGRGGSWICLRSPVVMRESPNLRSGWSLKTSLQAMTASTINHHRSGVRSSDGEPLMLSMDCRCLPASCLYGTRAWVSSTHSSSLTTSTAVEKPLSPCQGAETWKSPTSLISNVRTG